MPHSSGGGSHGGGSHGGGSHSSGSHSSGASSTPSYSKTYYSGAHCYVYYKNKKPVYFYSKDKDEAVSILDVIYPLGSAAICLFMFFIVVFNIIPIPKKLSGTSNDAAIIDNINVLDSTGKAVLEKTMNDFYDTTGIVPYLVTVSDSEWITHYTSLENYAYEWYVTHFDDEKHWLIMYSEPENKDDFNNWKWEGMQGDETDTILSLSITNQFTDTVQESLYKNGNIAFAVNTAFENIAPDLMHIHFNGSQFLILFPGLFVLIVVIQRIVYAVKQYHMLQYVKKAVQCDVTSSKPQEDTCEYCSGIYVHGLHLSCPHCGAPVKPLQTVNMQNS